MLITRLELNNVVFSAFLEVLVVIKALFSILIKSLEVSNIGRVFHKVREVVIELGDQHSKLGSPVTDMVNTVNFVAEEFKDTAD